MSSQQVVDYLTNNPHFFEEHADMLGSIQLTSPLAGRAVSLQERQMEILRDKYKALELRISALIRLAQENDTISQKFQQLTSELLLVRDHAQRPDHLVQHLQTIFGVPQVSMRLWQVAPPYANAWFAQPVDEEIKLFTAGLSAPYCGKNNGFEAVNWLPDAQAIKSTALLPLRNKSNRHAFGLLVLGSSDVFRFTAEMAIDFLLRVSDTASAALDSVLNYPELH